MYSFYIKKWGSPPTQSNERDKKRSTLSTCSPHHQQHYTTLPLSRSLPLCLLCSSPSLESTSLSFPSWQLAMLSLCFSLCWQFLQWFKLTALEGGGSCLLLYWGTCLLYCKDEGPWILDILPFSSLLLLLLPSHLDTVTVCSDLFFFSSEWQHMA